MKKTFKLATLVAVLSCSWSAAADSDSATYVGQWKMNPAESLNMPSGGGSQVTDIRRHDSILDYTWTGIDGDGKKETFSFTGPVDAKERALPGSDGWRGSMIRTPEGLIEGKLWFKDGSSEDKYCILSTPRKLTCFATYIDVTGKPSLYKEVFDKV